MKSLVLAAMLGVTALTSLSINAPVAKADETTAGSYCEWKVRRSCDGYGYCETRRVRVCHR